MTQETDSNRTPAFDSIWTGVNLATMTGPTSDYGILRDAALAVRDGRIAWLGPVTALDAAQRAELAEGAGLLHRLGRRDHECRDREGRGRLDPRRLPRALSGRARSRP